jgi:nucleoside-diphosphate-sugar epimerase
MVAGCEHVLVTGGSGFIGACLVRNLIAQGQDVHLLLRPESRRWRLAGLEGRYTAHAGDLCDLESVKQAVRRCRPEVIYHLAAHGAHFAQTGHGAILAANVLGTANLLEALAGHDYRALVHTGSSSEYGHKSQAMREDDRLEPRSDYAVAKAASTLLCQAEAYRGRPVTTVRIFSAYGPWEDPLRIASYVMDCCLRGARVCVTAGCQPRDFIYADDVVALLRLAAATPQARGEVLHAGCGRHQTVCDMVDEIVALCSRGQVPIDYGAHPLRADEPAVWLASIDRTTALTGWRPQYDLRAGIERMWAWFTARHASQAA